MRVTPRIAFAAIFLACSSLIALALYLQEQEGLEPCPMCILQRYAFATIGIVALAGAIHGPRGIALKVYGATTPGVLNGSMGFDEQTLEPTFVLRFGSPGNSAARSASPGAMGSPTSGADRWRRACRSAHSVSD